MKVLMDTSVLISFFVKQEREHDRVEKRLAFYQSQKAYFLVSSFILEELYTRLLYEVGSYHTKKIVYKITESNQAGEIKIIWIDKVIFQKAQEVFLKFLDHKISFTDATSYTLYKDLAIDEIFTLDSDFKKMRVVTSF